MGYMHVVHHWRSLKRGGKRLDMSCESPRVLGMGGGCESVKYWQLTDSGSSTCKTWGHR